MTPATKALFEKYNNALSNGTNRRIRNPIRSNIDFNDWSKRYQSLKEVFRENHDHDKTIELSDLGLYGVENCGGAASLGCVHCYGITMIDSKSTADGIRTKHIGEFRNCPIFYYRDAIRATWKNDDDKSFYKQQTMVLSKQLVDISTRINMFKDQAREPERDDKGNFKCLMCLTTNASVIAIPCLHFVMCAKCYLMAKAFNGQDNNIPNCIYCNTTPEYYSKVFGDTLES